MERPAPIVGSRVSSASKAAPEPHTKGAGHEKGYHRRGIGRAQGFDQRVRTTGWSRAPRRVAGVDRAEFDSEDGQEGPGAGTGFQGAVLLRGWSLRVRIAALDPGDGGGMPGGGTFAHPEEAGSTDQDGPARRPEAGRALA